MSAQFEKAYQVLKEVLDAPAAAFFSSCVNCGICADACLFYTETGEVKYTPIHKLAPLKRVWQQEFTTLGRVAKAVGLAKQVSDEELAEWAPLAYDACTLCSRCAMVCPQGLDPAYLIRRFREGLAVAGHAPAGLVEATTRAVKVGSPAGVKWATLEAQIRHVEKNYGFQVKVDQEGSDFLLLMSSWEILNYPEYLGSVGRILNAAGYSWTLSQDAFEATNSGIQIGVSDIARELVLRIVNTAERLKVKCVITPECGHAHVALRWEGPNLIGRPYKFDVKHILEVMDGLRRSGRIRLQGMLSQPLTYHDPCQISRRSGVSEPPRYLLRYLAPEFREMREGGVMNWCCGGGGGVSANERAHALQLQVFQKKRRQLEASGVKTVVTSCANCRVVMEEAMEHYGMDMEILGLTEIVAQYLVEPKPEENTDRRRG